MLTQLSITGFRCFRQLDVDLKPLTVLIGPNDTGKSAFLDAIEFLGSGTPEQLSELDYFRGIATKSFTISSTKERVESNRTDRSFARSTSYDARSIQRFQFPANGIVTECQGFDASDADSLMLTRDGSRVGALLDHLLRTDLKRFVTIRDHLQSLVPGFEELTISTPAKELRRVDFVVDGGLPLPAKNASAGVRLLLAFLSLVHHPARPRIILLEEPETGIHPKRLRDVMNLLRGISKGQFGNVPAQVILTTHSPYLLDYVEPEEDHVLVFQRTDDGSRTARPVDWGRLKEFFDGFLPGEILFNEEDAGFAREAS